MSVEPASVIRVRAAIAERTASLETELKLFRKVFEDHLEADRVAQEKIGEKLDDISENVSSILLNLAREEGRNEANARISRIEGSKWGAIVGGFVAGLAWVIKAITGH